MTQRKRSTKGLAVAIAAIVVFGAFSPTFAAAGQETELTGVVRSSLDGTPLPGATVHLAITGDDGKPRVLSSDPTGEDGRFSIPGCAGGGVPHRRRPR